MLKNKKCIPLYLLKILQENTDATHPITQSKLCEYLSKDGITCDRKTVSRNIDELIAFGYDIVKNIGGGCYLAEREFESSELAFLVDSIFSSQVIPYHQAEILIRKLTKQESLNERNRYKNLFKPDELNRTDNKQVFYNIDQINYAIENNKQITFLYNSYKKNKVLAPRKTAKYVINPYFMINSKGKYFLVCNKDNYSDISNYRIDYMTYVDVLDTTRKQITEVDGCKNGINPTKYANEHIYMFSGKSSQILLQLFDEKMINEVIDWFGKKVIIEENSDGTIFANLKANEQSVLYWSLQYGENVKVLQPESLRQKIKEIIIKMNENYK